jgi:hypothetical protein
VPFPGASILRVRDVASTANIGHGSYYEPRNWATSGSRGACQLPKVPNFNVAAHDDDDDARGRMLRLLLDGHALGQVAGLIHVAA